MRYPSEAELDFKYYGVRNTQDNIVNVLMPLVQTPDQFGDAWDTFAGNLDELAPKHPSQGKIIHFKPNGPTAA